MLTHTAVLIATVVVVLEVVEGMPVNKRLQAELTLVGCAPQFAAYVGIALVTVTTLSKYVLQKQTQKSSTTNPSDFANSYRCFKSSSP